MAAAENNRHTQDTPQDTPAGLPKTQTRKPKTPRHIVIKRIETVAQMMMQGAGIAEIWEFVSEKTDWNVSKRTVERYKYKADRIIEQEAKVNIDLEFGKALRRLNYLFARTLHLQDYKGALAVQKEINELLGLKTLKIQVDITDMKGRTTEEIEARIEEIQSKYIKQLGPGVTLNTKPGD